MSVEEKLASVEERGVLASAVKSQTRGVIFDLLNSELEIAETFVSVAETTGHRERALRNVANAWLALKTALELAEQLDMDSAERRVFRDRYGVLCMRLTDLQLRSQV
jgi:hypothetical protein